MSANTTVKKAMLSVDNTLVDENNLEIPLNSIIHCLGSLFQVTNAGLRHIVGKKIDNDTYFMNSELYRQLNELANPKLITINMMRVSGILMKSS